MGALAERLQALIRPGDTLWWGQATAEPLTLTRAVVQQRHALAQGGRLRVFVGIGASDTLQPGQADAIDFFGYAAGGPHRALAQAGVLDILPRHYSHLPGLIRAGVLPADSSVTWDRIGLTPLEQQQLAADRQRSTVADLVQSLRAGNGSESVAPR